MFDAQVRREIGKIAARLKIEEAALLAVAEVESAGQPVWNVNGKSLPAIRFEGHYFYRILKAKGSPKLKKAQEQGLAHPKAGAVKNPNNYAARYGLLERAAALDEGAAFESTSWGLGQVMGANWKRLGYASVQALVAAAKSGVAGQVDVMARYIEKFGLVDELQSQGFDSFALQYNGPAARKNNYAAKIRAAYRRWKNLSAGDAVLEGVMNWQRQLAQLGYYKGAIDGKVGRGSREALKAFQRESGLVPDGKFGPMTDRALDKATAEKGTKFKDNATRAGGALFGGGTGTIGVGETKPVQDMGQLIVDQVGSVAYYLPSSTTIGYIIGGVMLLGVGLIMYGQWGRFFGSKKEEDE